MSHAWIKIQLEGKDDLNFYMIQRKKKPQMKFPSPHFEKCDQMLSSLYDIKNLKQLTKDICIDT